MKRLLFFAPLLVLGCAHMSSTTERITTVSTNGTPIVTERTTASGFTFLDANASLAKFANRSGYATNASGTFAPGTFANQVNESSSGSNVVQILQAVATGVAAGLK